MDILIVKLAALGDVLRTTSLLAPLQARYPGCRISWITSSSARPLLENNPWLHEIFTVEQARAADLKNRFDLVLSLEEDAVAKIARAACRGDFVGIYFDGEKMRYTNSSAPYYDMSLLNRDLDGSLSSANVLKAQNTLTYAELWLKILELPPPLERAALRPVLVLTEEDRRAARKFAQKQSAIGLNPGAGSRWPAKQISPAKAARLLGALRVFKRPLMLFGGADEAARNAEIIKAAFPGLIDPGVSHDLRSFAALIELCEVVISTDSLAFHIATALGKKAVVLVGPTSVAELDVFGQGRKIVPVGGCGCFYRPRCQRAPSCLEEIPEGELIAAVEGLL